MDRDFDTVTLRLFVAVCEEGSIAGAAARESLVASAVSKRIAALEAQVGTPLLVRGRRGIAPTAAGQALLREARQVQQVMARLHAELSGFASGLTGSVRVVAAPSVLHERLADDIGLFLRQHPGVRVGLAEMVSPDIVRAVREGTADLGVLWDLTDLSALGSVAYRADHLCVAVPRGHRWARRARVRFDEVLDELNVAVAPGGMMDVLLRREAARQGRLPPWRIQVSGMDAAARMVAAGLGAAVLPREAIEGHAIREAIALLPLADAWGLRRFRVCHRADGSTTAAARLLLEHLAAQAARAPGADGAAPRGRLTPAA